MALFRLLHSPPTAHCSTHQILSSPLHKPLQPNAIISFPPLSLSLKLSIETRRLNLYQFHAPLSIKAQSGTQTQTSELVDGGEKVEQVEGEVSTTRLLAQNVPWTSTADDLRPLFEKYGTVVDIELSMYNKTRNRGLAFVTMSSAEEALAAFRNLESYEYEGRVLKLNWAKPKPKKESPATPPTPRLLPIHNLFVANLPFQARAKDLKEFFNANNGNIVSAEIVFQDNPRRSAGYGFVSFNTKEEAEAALYAFQGKEFMGRPLRVARSRRFLRQGTKKSIESDNATAELNSLEPSEEPDGNLKVD